VARVAVRDTRKARDVPLDPARFTDDPMAVIEDPGVDVVCELIAAASLRFAHPRRVRARQAGRDGEQGAALDARRELFDASEAKGLDLYFEAAVGGGIR